MFSVWICLKSDQPFSRYLSDKQNNTKSQTVLKTETYLRAVIINLVVDDDDYDEGIVRLTEITHYNCCKHRRISTDATGSKRWGVFARDGESLETTVIQQHQRYGMLCRDIQRGNIDGGRSEIDKWSKDILLRLFRPGRKFQTSNFGSTKQAKS